MSVDALASAVARSAAADGSSGSGSSGSSGSSNSSSATTMTQSDFLKLLVAQMTAQDPLNPTSNTEMAAQLAQYSTLQAAQGIQTKVTDSYTTQQLQTASTLIGKTVTVTDSNGTATSGTVTGAQVSDGAAQILIDGTAYNLSEVTKVTNSD